MENDKITTVENKTITPTIATLMTVWSDFATEHGRRPTMDELEALTEEVLKQRLNKSSIKEIAFWGLHAAAMIYGGYAPSLVPEQPGAAFRKD